MTEKPKKQLSDSFCSFPLVFLLPLIGFFVFAAFHDITWLYSCIIGLLIIIVYLVPLQRRLSQKKTSSQLLIQDIQEKINLLDEEIKKEELTISSYQDKIVRFSELKGLTEQLGMTLSIDDTARVLVERANHFLGDKETTIILYLFHHRVGELAILLSQRGEEKIHLKTKKGDAFDHWVMKSLQPLLIEDMKNEYRFDMDKVRIEGNRGIRSLISVPLIVGNKPLGVLRLDHPRENYFSMEELRFLTTIGDLGAIAIENAQLYERVEQLAIRDSLTNLYLRRHLLDRLQEEISRHSRQKSSLSFLMIDLDKFKQYNDKFGHTAGDIVLRTVGMILGEMFTRPGNVVCRYGGEEFCVLLADCPKTKAFEMAEVFRKKVSEQVVYLRRERTHITVSVGVSSFPKDTIMKEELIQKADQALYNAKKSGRNTVCAAEE